MLYRLSRFYVIFGEARGCMKPLNYCDFSRAKVRVTNEAKCLGEMQIDPLENFHAHGSEMSV